MKKEILNYIKDNPNSSLVDIMINTTVSGSWTMYVTELENEGKIVNNYPNGYSINKTQ